ncbi:jg23698, partial [Pararge aegeria aegeria]
GKHGVLDPRFLDVVKLNDYLQHGRRPQFWEENYVKRVMEAVRVKELEMKQAAEILGVSYGTLYGRYRDVYGCINRPYR